MLVSLDNIGKKFGREWIFRGVNAEFNFGSPTVILGANGSGKSTLLQIISGSLMTGEGKMKYSENGKDIPEDEIYPKLSYASPYLELMEEMTLEEMIAFQQKFKKWRKNYSNKDVLELSGLAKDKNKFIRNFSSGMKMRTKLTLAILADTSLLLLDEPCSNLDHAACKWYGDLVSANLDNRTAIVCSNEMKDEYFFCKKELRIEDFKLVGSKQ
ncbi:MAG TPA: ATP-binding cassette domain-containing protein [Bacteroidia bacterium]|jgi:ABC-type multidrug transport system ATPase subunit|nr:ATP-binding cassette domain-containing protein [Bacteroidia bacterium]